MSRSALMHFLFTRPLFFSAWIAACKLLSCRAILAIFANGGSLRDAIANFTTSVWWCPSLWPAYRGEGIGKLSHPSPPRFLCNLAKWRCVMAISFGLSLPANMHVALSNGNLSGSFWTPSEVRGAVFTEGGIMWVRGFFLGIQTRTFSWSDSNLKPRCHEKFIQKFIITLDSKRVTHDY